VGEDVDNDATLQMVGLSWSQTMVQQKGNFNHSAECPFYDFVTHDFTTSEDQTEPKA